MTTISYRIVRRAIEKRNHDSMYKSNNKNTVNRFRAIVGKAITKKSAIKSPILLPQYWKQSQFAKIIFCNPISHIKIFIYPILR